tara:strand:- start:1430 stop:1630 length:201 start_codon:yes stop_codon:yes gene_type:complete
MINEMNVLDIRSDSEVDDRIVSRMDPSLVDELRLRFLNEGENDHSFESFCVRYMLEMMHDMDHTNF